MSEIIEYKRCVHCNESGTCRNGKDGESCHGCSFRFVSFFRKNKFGERCSVCNGTGFIEPISTRLTYRAAPVIGILIVSTILVITAYGMKDHFSEIITFVGTLAGSVVGFYFSKKK